MTSTFSLHLDSHPYVAILRGLTAAEAPLIGDALHQGGWRSIEVPLNRPGAIDALRSLSDHLAGSEVLIGAGTITRASDFDAAREAGAHFFLSPHTDSILLDYASTNALDYVPGCATPSDVMTAVSFAAEVIKLFPYSLLGPEFISAMRGVTDESIRFMAVGGVSLDTIDSIIPPANYAGVGSALYRPGMTSDDVAAVTQKWRKVIG